MVGAAILLLSIAAIMLLIFSLEIPQRLPLKKKKRHDKALEAYQATWLDRNLAWNQTAGQAEFHEHRLFLQTSTIPVLCKNKAS